MSERILVVDDEAVLRANLVRFLSRIGHDVQGVATAEDALEHLSGAHATVVITDLRMPGIGGMELLRQIIEQWPETMVLVITAYASIESAIQALRYGAQDYLLKPLSLEDVSRKVTKLLAYRAMELRLRRLRMELHQRYDTEGMVVVSPAMQHVMQLVGKLAASPSSVLIEGESGTGKELIARALHERSPVHDQDFIPVNIAALPADLVDATLFGHERGAYTGASSRREGVFRSARGGVVFLDEIGELPASLQPKLLRVLENREVLPLGANRPQPVDFRLIAATNRSLLDMVDEGRFREDLYYRLAVLRVRVPPLRERPEDIGPLVWHYLEHHGRLLGRPPPRPTNDAMNALQTHHWPGNVRELANAMERAVLLAEEDWINLSDLSSWLFTEPSMLPEVELKPAVEAFERRHITRVLLASEMDKPATAKRLGIHLATLYRYLERLGMEL